MKKLLLLLALVMGFSTMACAGDTYAHDASVLPAAAKSTLANNFKAGVSVVKIEKTLGMIKEYEVVLQDGTEISFDKDGNWENVETNKNKKVPSAFIPKGVQNFVSKTHPGTHVVGIDKERNGYDVELSNGIDIKFDKQGNFKKYDD